MIGFYDDYGGQGNEHLGLCIHLLAIQCRFIHANIMKMLKCQNHCWYLTWVVTSSRVLVVCQSMLL